MKIHDPNFAALASTGASKAQEATSLGTGTRAQNTPGQPPGAGDDVHLSELVRSLRSLAATSPERQARIEQIARAHAAGNYQVDAQATASKIVDDALKH
jgi:flagellar biosynthesis anti-sigma factor FlgM